jgi:hypothetical protein
MGMPSQSTSVTAHLASASRISSQIEDDLLCCKEVMQEALYSSPLHVPVECVRPPKGLRKKQMARKTTMPVPFNPHKHRFQQSPGLVDDDTDLFNRYKTPPSRHVLQRMIRSARMKLVSIENTPRCRIALDKFARHLQMQFDSLYTKKPPKSCARYHNTATDTTTTNAAVAARCQYTADMNAIQRSLTVDPVFEDLLVNRNVWSKEADGVHGESMAIFSSAHMDVVGFADDEYSQHSRNYVAFVRDIDEGVDPGMAIKSDPLAHDACIPDDNANLTGIVSLTDQKTKAEFRGPLFALQYDTFRFVYCTILSYFLIDFSD